MPFKWNYMKICNILYELLTFAAEMNQLISIKFIDIKLITK